MPIEKTMDGRKIEFPEGYDTPEGRKRIVAERMSYSKENKMVLLFILARGIIKELGGDDMVWKDSNGNWNFSPPRKLIDEMKERFNLRSESGSREAVEIAHPIFSDLWKTDGEGNSHQDDLHTQITIRRSALWKGAQKISNPSDDDWTEELHQKCDSYFREIVKLLRMLKSKSTSPKHLDDRYDKFEEAFNQSYFANFIKLPENLREERNAFNAIGKIANSFKMLDKEKVRHAIEEQKVKEEKVASDLVQRIIEGEDITIVNEFESQLNETQDRHSLLLKLQRQIGNVSPDKRPIVVERFNRDRILSEYIKELYGWKCQICGFTFKQNNGRLYAETHHLEALSKGGKDSLDNMVVVCPNHHAMFDHADVSILDVTPEKISVMINGEQLVIKRILLR